MKNNHLKEKELNIKGVIRNLEQLMGKLENPVDIKLLNDSLNFLKANQELFSLLKKNLIIPYIDGNTHNLEKLKLTGISDTKKKELQESISLQTVKIRGNIRNLKMRNNVSGKEEADSLIELVKEVLFNEDYFVNEKTVAEYYEVPVEKVREWVKDKKLTGKVLKLNGKTEECFIYKEEFEFLKSKRENSQVDDIIEELLGDDYDDEWEVEIDV